MTASSWTKQHLLLLEPLPEPTLASLAEYFIIHPFTNMDDLAKIAPDIRAIATGGSYGVAPEVMAALPHLEIIAVNGVGLDKIDLTGAQKRHIRVTVTTDISTNDVADMAMLLLLALKRNLKTNEQFLLDGNWAAGKLPPLAHSLNGRKLGIAGFGRIGQAVARRAQASNMEVAYFNPHPREGSTLTFEPSLKALAAWADILVITLPATAATKNIVNADILAALGKNGVLINTARGSVIDEEALLTALKSKSIAGAGLDVFQNEPTINPAFLTLDNVVLQPHQASATIETRLAMGQNIIDNLLAYFSGKPLLTPAC
ncbi:2-hydroxyacid dehydrogenase [Bombella favorum]|uniref:Dihydrofolate reductase n=1 Tax=Bombella favorum TaxID=2039164 RepID=A0ABR5ZND2_9PROT|nr:2-hydroxyacid dehydrogenase [Bombella favorum]MBA5725810.1 dihydrofolate reductase [Bombella favorum]